ncbi:MAG: hypothetical protein ABFR95_04240 [Actinomycetota bacterium]
MRSVQLIRVVCVVVALGLAACEAQSNDANLADGSTQTSSTSSTPVFEGTTDEWAAAMVDCMRAEGFDAHVDGTGYAIPNITGDARRLASEANSLCKQQVGVIPATPMDGEQLALHLGALLKTAECLRDEGYSVSEAPAEAVFIESYSSGDAWNPYTDIVRLDVTDTEWARLNEACPQP